MKRPIGALMALCATLGGCALGPNYHRPPSPTLGAGPFVSEAPGLTQGGDLPDDWWRLYKDPVLDRLLRRAFAANADIRVAEANLAEARAALSEARAGLFPSTNLSIGSQYGRNTRSNAAGLTTAGTTPGAGLGSGGGSSTGAGTTGTGTTGTGTTGTGTTGTGTTGAGTTGTGSTGSGSGNTTNSNTTSTTGAGTHPAFSYDAAFDVSYEVDLFGRVRRTLEASRADLGAQQAALDAVRITVAAETARAYADGCAYAEEAAVARRSLKIVQDTYNITLIQRSAGAGSDYDVARAGALLEAQAATIPTLDGERQANLFALTALIGVTPREVPPEAVACTAAPLLYATFPVGDGAALLRRRPDVREAERNLAAATARIGVATAELFPVVTLGGSISTFAGQHENILSNSAVSYGIGPLISWSFPNILAARARLGESKARAQAQLANFDGAVLTALKEVEQALSTYGAEVTRHAALVRGKNDSEAAYKLAALRYKLGAVSYLDLLTTEQTLITAESSLAASDETLAADQIAVFKALGGGWRSAETS